MVLRLAAFLPRHRMRIVEADQPLAIRPVQRCGGMTSMSRSEIAQGKDEVRFILRLPRWAARFSAPLRRGNKRRALGQKRN
jgi:hypothetical protein